VIIKGIANADLVVFLCFLGMEKKSLEMDWGANSENLQIGGCDEI
jgi:hypothetical protein